MNSPSSFSNTKDPDYEKQKQEEKLLVAEQPGFSYGLLAIFIALLLGFSWRAFFSPLKIKSRIEQAATKVHKDFRFEVGEASLSLSRGLFPEFAIVVNNVKFFYLRNCYFSPEGEIDQLRLPISLRQLLSGQVEFEKLKIHRLDLRLKEKYSDCRNSDSNNPNVMIDGRNLDKSITDRDNKVSGERAVFNQAVARPSLPSMMPRAVAAENNSNLAMGDDMKVVKKKYPIRRIEMDMVKLDYWPVNGASLRLKDFDLQLQEKKLDEVIITLASELSFGADSQIFETTSKSDLKLNLHLQDGVANFIESRLQGFWREGNFLIEAKSDLLKNQWEGRVQSKYIPLSQIFSVLKKTNLMQSDYDGRDIWLTFDSHLSGSTTQWAQTQVDLEKFHLEGEIGDIELPEIHVRSLDPFQFSSFEGHLKSVRLEKALRLFGRNHPGSTFSNLGRLHGRFKVSSLKEFEMDLEHSGLELIFSNKGQRRLQTISLIRGQVRYAQNQWSLKVDDLRPSEGIFDGKAYLLANEDFKDILFDLKFNELSLDPEIYKLMTSENQVEPFRGDLKVQFKNGELKQLKSDLATKKLNVEGVQMESPILRFESKNSSIQGFVGAKTVLMTAKSKSSQFFKTHFSTAKFTQAEAIHLRQMQMQFQTDWLKNLQWKLRTDEPRISSDGEWSDKGVLSGDLLIKDKGQTFKYHVEGLRDDPRLVEIH